MPSLNKPAHLADPGSRTLRPGQVITMEYNPERINLRLDNRDVIESLGCG